MKLSCCFLFTLAAFLWNAADVVVAAEASKNLVEVAQAFPHVFSTLVDLVLQADDAVLERLTSEEQNTTVFAPTNDAFRALPSSTVAYLENNPDILTQVLLYHAVDGEVFSDDIPSDGQQDVPTLFGEETVVVERVTSQYTCWVIFTCTSDFINVNAATVLVADISASNGVVHAIDSVLIPPGLPLLDIVDTAISQHLDTLVAAVVQAGLVDTLRGDGPFTVFAPSEDAWKALPAGLLNTLLLDDNVDLLADILTYHVIAADPAVRAEDVTSQITASTVNGNTLTLRPANGTVVVADSTAEDANVITANIETTNGIVHVIDKVLIPPGALDGFATRSIVDIATSDSDLSALVEALLATDLVDELSCGENFTVFAPVNSAFAAINDTVASLDIDSLQEVLLYHVVSGSVNASVVVTLPSVQTLNGQSVTIRVDGSRVFLNEDVEVLVTDIFASNGVIHKIDAVLLPDLDDSSDECEHYDWICDWFGFFDGW